MTATQAQPGFTKWLDSIAKDAINAAHNKTDTYYKPIDNVSDKAAGISEKWGSLNNVDQLLVGMSFLGAAMSTVSAFKYARNSVTHNEQGEASIRPSMVWMALLNAAFAIGGALVGGAIMKNAHTRL